MPCWADSRYSANACQMMDFITPEQMLWERQQRKLGLLPCLTLAVSSPSPFSQPPWDATEALWIPVTASPWEGSRSPHQAVIDVTVVPGAAPLIFNVASLQQRCRQEELVGSMSRLCGATGRALMGKGFLSPSAWWMSTVPALFSSWLNSERARAACGPQWDNKTAD